MRWYPPPLPAEGERSSTRRRRRTTNEMGHMLGLPFLYGNPNKPRIDLGVYDPMAYAGGCRGGTTTTRTRTANAEPSLDPGGEGYLPPAVDAGGPQVEPYPPWPSTPPAKLGSLSTVWTVVTSSS